MKKRNSLPRSSQVPPDPADDIHSMIHDVDELVTSAVSAVFETMMNTKVVSKPLEAALGEAALPHVAGSVGFIGRVSGVVYIHATEAFARRITRTLLGLEDSEVQGQEMVNDAMGEMANMIVGHMKSRLSDRGMPCVLTIPSVVRGTNFCIEAVSSTEGRVYVFECAHEHLLVEFLAKQTPLAN
jgi:chemotaxis protein CheX